MEQFTYLTAIKPTNTNISAAKSTYEFSNLTDPNYTILWLSFETSCKYAGSFKTDCIISDIETKAIIDRDIFSMYKNILPISEIPPCVLLHGMSATIFPIEQKISIEFSGNNVPACVLVGK